MFEQPRVRNAADKRQVRRAERLQKEIDERYDLAMRWVLGTPDGRSFVWELLRKFGLYETPWSDSPHAMARNIGRTDAAREILADAVRVDMRAYLVMEQEARAWQQRDEQRLLETVPVPDDEDSNDD